MIIGSAFTLFVVPSIYVLVARTHRGEAMTEEREEREEREEETGAGMAAAL